MTSTWLLYALPELFSRTDFGQNNFQTTILAYANDATFEFTEGWDDFEP
jgi:hypothetical protein